MDTPAGPGPCPLVRVTVPQSVAACPVLYPGLVLLCRWVHNEHADGLTSLSSHHAL